MNYDELVQLITKEVMNRLKDIMAEQNSANKKKVLILEKEENLCPVLKEALIDKNYDVHCIDNMGELESYSGIVLQNLSKGELVNLSHGIEGSVKESLAIKSIFMGYKIHCMEKGVEYKKYAETSNKVFFKLFEDHENKLKAYGISFVGLKGLLADLENKDQMLKNNGYKAEIDSTAVEQPVESTLNGFADLSDKKLVSEVELRSVCKKGIKDVVVSKRTILTPLAMDYARVNKLKISKR